MQNDMELTLLRFEQTSEYTLGLLLGEGARPLMTLEPPWLINAQGASCIPARDYDCVRHYSPKFGETFWLTNVPNRQEIIFHSGNIVQHTRGCILLGLYTMRGVDTLAIHKSRIAMGEFLKLMKGQDTLKLVVTERF